MTPIEACTVLLLHLNETAGPFMDSSPRRVAFRAFGAAGSTASAKFGLRAYEASATAATAAGLISDAAPAQPATGIVPITLSAYVRMPARTAFTGAILHMGNSPGVGLGLRIQPGGNLRLFRTRSDTNGDFSLISASAIPLGEWCHVAACVGFDGVSRLFINGVLDANTATSDGPQSSGSEYAAIIGNNHSGSGNAFSGAIDEVRYLHGYAAYHESFTPEAAPFADCPPVTSGNWLPGARRIVGRERPGLTPRLISASGPVVDMVYGGAHMIPGTVRKKDTPANAPLRRRVRLFRERDGQLVRETWSSAVDGSYLFKNIDGAYRYTVVAYDHEHNFRAVIGDNISPEPMP